MKLKALLAALSLSFALNAQAETYTIDPNHTQVRFQYSHFGLSTIVGLFTGVSGEINYDPANPAASSVKASIPITEVHTGVEKFNAHLISGDFFDAASFPTAEFTSSKVESSGDNQLKVTGTLKVRDVEHEVVLDVHLNAVKLHPMSGKPVMGLDATTTLLRTALGVGKFAPNVSDEVKIEITVEAGAAKA